MKPIGLTGHPEAQHTVGLQLAELTTHQALNLKLFIGVMTVEEANQIHTDGGELWQCGPYAPTRDLAGRIDRVLPGTTQDELGPQVATSLADMLAKTNLTGEIA